MRLCGWVNKTTGDSIGFMDDLESIQELAFSGIQIINMKLLHDMPVKKMSIIPLYLSKAKDNAIMGFQHDSDYWFDCGKVESLDIAATFVQQNPLK
jgi:NDP-sugar pyrophosphorylase family protein